MATRLRTPENNFIAEQDYVANGITIVDSLTTEIERVRADRDFTKRAKRLLARDKELLDRLAK